MRAHRLFTAVLLAALLLTPVTARAQDGLLVSVTTTVICGDVDFEVSVSGGTGPYSLAWDFGDGETLAEADVTAFPHTTSHTYPGAGDYEWTLTVGDPTGEATVGGSLSLGPRVTLNASEMPPIFFLDGGAVSVDFSAEVAGGEAPFTYDWSFEGAAASTGDPASPTASATYDAPGKYTAGVTVTDACGLSHSDTLTIVVFDPEEACHPMAERIAEAVSSLYPDQATQLYACEDIFDFFQGGLTGSQLGFGRMWHAYQLALVIEELTWEDILDWHLEGSGWGLLLQLDRFAEALDEVSLTDLMARVLSGETTVHDVRTAVRMVTQYEADFEDALSRLAEGASPGELNQFYRAASDLGVAPEVLDGYLEMGVSLAELRHAARMAESTGGDWATILEAHASGHSWGEIQQAFRLADEDTDAATILAIGVKEYRRQLREEAKAERQEAREARQEDKLAERDERMASKIAAQYGVSEAEVWAVYNDPAGCNGDWACVRAHFRGEAKGEHGPPEGKGGGPPEGKGPNK